MYNSESGRIDIVFSLVLLVSSALMLSYGSTGLYHLLSEQEIAVPFSRDQNRYVIIYKREKIGIFDISVSDRSELQVNANLLGQVKKGELKISLNDDEIVLSLSGIYPLNWLTEVRRVNGEQSSNSSAQEILELELHENKLLISKKEFAKHTLRVLNLLKLSVINEQAREDYETVALKDSGLSFRRLKKVFLEAHIEK